MKHRTHSPFDEENPNELRNKEFKIKHKRSKDRNENHKKVPKIYDGDVDGDDNRNYEYKGKQSNDYPMSKNLSSKCNQNYQRDFSNEKQTAKYYDSDHENKYRGREDRGIKYPNREKPHKKNKEKMDRKTMSRDYLRSEDGNKQKKSKFLKTSFGGSNRKTSSRESNTLDSYDSNVRNNIYNRKPKNDLKYNSTSRKSNKSYQRDFSNEQQEVKYHNSEYESEYRGGEDLYMRSPNVERLLQESNEDSRSGGKSKLKKSNSTKPIYEKYDKIYTKESYDAYDSNDVEYDFRNMPGEEKDFNSEDNNENSLSSESDKSEESGSNSVFENNPGSPKHFFRNKDKNINIIARSEWDPEPGDPEDDQLPQQPFNHINYVDTGSPMCLNQDDCVYVMRYIKERDKSIKYNFYIGGDNLIYEGKGWVADTNEKTGYRKRSLDIAFIGVFTGMRPPPPMLFTSYNFVQFGISSRLVLKDFSHDFKMRDQE